MSIGSLTIILSLLENKNYEREYVQKCVIETSKRTKEKPNDVLLELIDKKITGVKFPVTLEDYGSFKTVEAAVDKMKQTILKDGVKDKLKFVFRFKTFYLKVKSLNTRNYRTLSIKTS